LDDKIMKVEEEHKMPYVTSWEKSAELRGIKLGEEQGVKKGERRGERNGKKKEKVDVARRMLNDKFSVDNIVKYTGLKNKEVEALKNCC
jgi:predicted transposase/invertase (TIGR01784 family)